MSLESLYHKPDREELGRILLENGVRCNRGSELLMYELMTWPEGKKKEQYWCQHMKEKERRQQFETGWKFCPICGAPRPL